MLALRPGGHNSADRKLTTQGCGRYESPPRLHDARSLPAILQDLRPEVAATTARLGASPAEVARVAVFRAPREEVATLRVGVVLQVVALHAASGARSRIRGCRRVDLAVVIAVRVVSRRVVRGVRVRSLAVRSLLVRNIIVPVVGGLLRSNGLLRRGRLLRCGLLRRLVHGLLRRCARRPTAPQLHGVQGARCCVGAVALAIGGEGIHGRNQGIGGGGCEAEHRGEDSAQTRHGGREGMR
mmetsp:Transcript_116201/g.324986  ORF Transcript_116201/g.324986 Transcript_116201/m.324986 type:complete len:240 (+) Transcript_116201:359-1078(+)